MHQNNLVQITIKGKDHPTEKKHKQKHSLGSEKSTYKVYIDRA